MDVQPLIQFDEEEEDIEWIREAQERTDSTIIKTRANVPPIPEGMKYHLFISHSNEDEEEVKWVQKLVEDMEEKCGYKCLWPSRDFTPGHDIPTLIQNGISNSMKTVCVLSESSLISGWCKYEWNMAFILSVQERKNRVIPLLLQQCEVPNIFRTINYIDVPKGDDYIQRIQRCFSEHQDMKDIIPNMANILQNLEDMRDIIPNMANILQNLDAKRMLSMEPDQLVLATNGIQFRITADPHFTFRGVAWSFADACTALHQESNDMETAVMRDVYTKAKDIANQTLHLKFYSLTNSLWRSPSIYVLVLLFVIFLAVLICDLVEVTQNRVWGFIFVVTTGLIAGISIFIFMVAFNIVSFWNPYNRILSYSLQQVMKTNVLVNYQRNTCGPPIIQIMKYDMKPCMSYLSDCLLQKSSSVEEIGEEDRRAVWTRGESMMLNFLRCNNDRIFLWTLLPTTTVNRHPTQQSKACLCEMVEVAYRL